MMMTCVPQSRCRFRIQLQPSSPTPFPTRCRQFSRPPTLLLLLLLLLTTNLQERLGVHGFVVKNANAPAARQHLFASSSANTNIPPSSSSSSSSAATHPAASTLLPPRRPSPQPRQRRRQRPGHFHSNNATHHQATNSSIPSTIPRLSALLHDNQQTMTTTRRTPPVSQQTKRPKKAAVRSLSTTPKPKQMRRTATTLPTVASSQHNNNNNNNSTADAAAHKQQHITNKAKQQQQQQHRKKVAAQRKKSPGSPPPRQRYHNSTTAAPKRNNKNQKRRPAPWKADYYTSYRSQAQLKAAHRSGGAHSVLETLLALPPTACNGANLCCALTLSAQQPQQQTVDATTLRPLVYRVVQIVHDVLLLEQQQQPTHTSSSSSSSSYFTLRQLANIAWALAKLYDRDHGLMMADPEEEKDGMDGSHRNNGPERMAVTVDVLATTITHAMTQNATGMMMMKEQELCMTSWAYGILRRRRRPPGWQQGPVVGRVVDERSTAAAAAAAQPFSFVQVDDWNRNTRNDAPSTAVGTNTLSSASSSTLHTPTGRLLDAIGTAFCPPPTDDEINSKEGDGDGDDVDSNPYPRIRNCLWRELANVIWAYASHGRAGGSPITVELAGAVADEATRRLRLNRSTNSRDRREEPILSRDIAQIIWSLGVLQADDYRIADPLVRFVEAFAATRPAFRSWSCADLVQVALSLAHARLDETALMTALYAEANERLLLSSTSKAATSLQTKPSGFSEESRRKSFYAWEISILLWAQARLYLTADQHSVFRTFQEHSVVQLQRALQGATFSSLRVGPQEQANIAWSLAVLASHDDGETSTTEASSFDDGDESPTAAVSAILRAIFEEAATACHTEGAIQLEHAHQLWQALFLLEPSCPECFEAVPAWFRSYLEEQWKEEKTRPKVSSARHRALSKTLNLMGVAHYNEHDEDIDVAIVLEEGANWTHETVNSQVKEGMRVAVEFDGPVHFTRQKFPPVIGRDGKPVPPRALGPTVLKYRLLKQQGWSVVRVPYYEFDKIPFWASMERQRYVQRLLKTHGSLKFSDVDVSAYAPAVANRLSRFD